MSLQRPVAPENDRITRGGPRPGWSIRTRTVAAATTVLLAAGGSLLFASSASAAPPVSIGEGRFLSGSALGLDLSTLASLQPANALNSGGGAVTEAHPLSVTALNALTVDLGSGLNLLGDNGILTLGAVNQFARAQADGSSLAASGAVTNTGGIGVGGQDGVPQSNASFDLSGLTGGAPAGSLADLTLTVGAVSATAAQAAGSGGAQSGDYGIAGLSLDLTSPALGQTIRDLRTTLVALQPTVDAVPETLEGLLGGLVTVNGLPQLGALVDGVTVVTSADGSIVANLQTGAITIDVAALLTSQGVSLNDLGPNTELLPYITTGLTTQLLPALTSALTGLTDQITSSLSSVTAAVGPLPVSLAVLGPVLQSVLTTVLAPVDTVVSGLGGAVVTPLANGLTGVLSLRGNVQATTAGVFTQRALRVALLPGANPLAVVNLASAAVGPNAGPAPAVLPTATDIDPAQGPVTGGTPVTITGTDFTVDSTVSIDGGAPITPTAVADDGTTVTFTTPEHALGDVDVTVTTPGGTTEPQTFTYIAAVGPVPTATGLDPAEGPVTGGTPVTVTGTGFTADSTVSLDGGPAIEPTNVADDGTTVTFTTPEHAVGDVDVTVTTPGGTTDPLTFTYVAVTGAVPTATGIDPAEGPVTGGTPVTVTGTGFTADSTVSLDGGPAIEPTNVADDGTTVTFTTPEHVVGDVDVTVTTPGGTTDPQTFTYVAVVGAVPTATGIDPAEGPVTGGTPVTVTGTGFTADSTVSVDGGPAIEPTNVADDGTTVTFTTPEHVVGDVDVTVTTPGGTTDPLTFTYVAVVGAVPTATGIDPAQGPVTGGTPVTVSGTGFTSDSTISLDGGPAIEPTNVADDGTTVTFTTPEHAAGDVDVTVTTPGGTTDPQTFTYVAVAGAVPTATGIDPDQGPVSGGTLVTVTGTGFVAGSTVSVDGGPAIVPTSIGADGTTVTFSTPAHAVGDVDVTVTTPGGTTDPQTFTYVAVVGAVPTATGLDPDHGPRSGGTTVTVTGTGFTPGSTVSIDGQPAITPETVSTDGTTLTFITPAHVPGAVPVTVTTPGGTTDSLTFTYDPATTTTTAPPVITSPTGGSTVTTGTPPITGSGTPGGTVTVTDGDGTTVCTTVVASDGGWVCRPIAPLATGTVTIRATQTGADGTSAPSDPVTFTVAALGLSGGSGAGDGSGSGTAGLTSGNLAFTGSDAASGLFLAGALLALGLVLTAARFVGRRRVRAAEVSRH